MAPLFNCELLETKSQTVTVKISSIHPDSGPVTETPAFALMVLFDAAKGTRCPLLKTIDLDQLIDADWLSSYAKGIIQSSKIKNIDIAPNSNNTMALEFTLEIITTHTAWIAHVKGQQSWETTAYTPAIPYKKCDPIFPKGDAPSSNYSTNTSARCDMPLVKVKTGVIPVWKYMISHLLTSTKDVLWLQEYSRTVYKKVEEQPAIEIVNADLNALEGGLFKVGNDVGVLYKRATDWGLFELGSSSCGSTFLNGDKLVPMVLNEEKTEFRTPFSIESTLKYGKPVVFDASTENETLTLKVLLTNPENSLVTLDSKADALQLLMKPFGEENTKRFEEGHVLTTLLNSEMDKLGLENTDDIFKNDLDIVNTVIQDYRIEKLGNMVFPKLENLNHNAILDLYQFNKWPQYRIHIKVSQSDFLTHYEEKLPFAHVFGML